MTIVWKADGMYGLSSDTKPTNVPENTKFVETDTRIEYRLVSGSWVDASGAARASSLYEVFDPLTTIRKQQFVEWFAGGDIRSIWTKTNVGGTNAFAMSDLIDEGYVVEAGSTAGNAGVIHPSTINHFSQTACIFIVVARRVGLSNTQPILCDTTSFAHFAEATDNSSASFKTLETKDGTTASGTNTDVAIDENWHMYKIECGSSNIKLYVDGVLKVTKTTNRPGAALMPAFLVASNSSGTGRQGRIRYLEAYNT